MGPLTEAIRLVAVSFCSLRFEWLMWLSGQVFMSHGSRNILTGTLSVFHLRRVPSLREVQIHIGSNRVHHPPLHQHKVQSSAVETSHWTLTGSIVPISLHTLFHLILAVISRRRHPHFTVWPESESLVVCCCIVTKSYLTLLRPHGL